MTRQDNETGPAAEVLPAMQAAHERLSEGLKAAGHADAIFAIVVLLPSASDAAGQDVIRAVTNLPVDAVAGFLQHIARALDDKLPTEGAQMLSLQQAMQLVALLKAGQKI